jgi:hypothetical protein
MLAEGKSFWYAMVYLTMCFSAAAFQEKIKINGVLTGDSDR